MKIYLVGGAVRDRLLGLEVNERDWVVVGASPEQMLALKFKPVGKEFPVFLHPKTHEEYALARTEKKIARGYKGFTFYTSPDVTLEQDLLRRDLTINAIAEDAQGNLIDPYHGQDDLQKKILRHVSPAFQEDPVRLLRIARFAAKFPSFSVHPDTMQLISNMVIAGEINALVPERVWQELQRALANKAPANFFAVLNNCGALNVLFSAIKYPSKAIKLLEKTDTLPTATHIRFAILTHEISEKDLRNLNNHYHTPNQFAELALLLCKNGVNYATLDITQPADILKLLKNLDALRRGARFLDFITAANICYGSANQDILQKSLSAIKNIDTTALQQANIIGREFADKLQQLQINAIAACT